MLIRLGGAARCDGAVSRDSRRRSFEGECPSDNTLRVLPRLRFDEQTTKLIERMDVLWLQPNSFAGPFEIEHWTQVYSSLLRLVDLVALQPNIAINLFIVSDAARKDKVMRELNRPTFVALRRRLVNLYKFISHEAFDGSVEAAGAVAGPLDVEIINDIAQVCSRR